MARETVRGMRAYPKLNIRYPVHGVGSQQIPVPVSYRGGVFGGPVLPAGRTGIFRDHWALPSNMVGTDTGIFYPYTHQRIPESDFENRFVSFPPGLAGLRETWAGMTTREKAAWVLVGILGFKIFCS